MERQDPELVRIWRQQNIPVIFKQPKSNPLLVKLPYSQENFAWLRAENRKKPTWNGIYKAWEVPVSWFDNLIHRALKKYHQVYVIQIYKLQQKCAPACWNAQGFHCECSCMGAHHGSGHPGNSWHEVSETFAFEWGKKQYACRLISETLREKQA